LPSSLLQTWRLYELLRWQRRNRHLT
jgi:hypothetical protein